MEDVKYVYVIISILKTAGVSEKYLPLFDGWTLQRWKRIEEWACVE